MPEHLTDIERMRHSGAHVLAQAVVEMFPEAKLAIGPPIENGFYYDFDLPRALVPEDLPLIEEKMKRIQKEKQIFIPYKEPKKKAIEFLKTANQDYKVEMAMELEDDEVGFYVNEDKDGNKTFVDMCRGPHVETTKNIGYFKLMSIAGAYWRGDEKNKMLQRIYAVSFPSKDELNGYLKQLEEAKKRDHRELGKRMELFSFHEEGVGFPFWHPKGMVLRNELINFWKEVHAKYKYDEVSGPAILNESLWHQSGHWDNYKENMYFTEIDETAHAVKPMNCPGQILIYKNTMHSYKEFPLRWAELGHVHRHEKSGVLHGLFRVRSFTQDDAHHFCLPGQVEDELKLVLDLTEEIYSQFDLDYHIELSTRPEKSIGSDEMWEKAEDIMRKVIKESGREYRINEGDGAFYGPKFDFHIKDCIGRTWQCGTLQLDFSMPERFEMEYIGPDGKEHRPVMLHRAILGSLERFIGIIIEHYGGIFPTWLAPVQAKILPISDKHIPYAEKVYKELEKRGVRVELDDRSESLGKKIRDGEMEKAAYLLVVGDEEAEDENVAVRKISDKKQEVVKLKDFVSALSKEINERK